MADIAAAAKEAKITIAESRATLKEIEATAAAARKTLEDPEFRELPADLRKSHRRACRNPSPASARTEPCRAICCARSTNSAPRCAPQGGVHHHR